MALREVTVEVIEKYIVSVEANDADEAKKKARMLVACGCYPYEVDEIILDVQPVQEVT